jgi:RNA polymerase sigma factor (sigma-70 family)
MAATESGHLASREIDDLYRAHVGEVYRYALAVLGNHADAEDVTQTTFLNAYRALEQGVHPRKPSNWLLTIASNAIKQRFRQEQSGPRQVELDDRIADKDRSEDEGPSVGELLTALAKIPPQQRQAIVLREFEGRSYAEIAEILGVTTTALETLLFRARRSLAEELAHQLTCTEAQLSVSRSADGRLGRKERRRLRDHLAECPDCARFARLQQRHRSALRGLALVPIPVSLTLFKGFEGTASAAVVPITAGTTVAAVGAGAAGIGTGATAAGAGVGGGLLAGSVGLKAAAVVAAASVAGGVGVVGAHEISQKPAKTERVTATQPGARLGQVAPRGVSVPGNGVARGKLTAPGQTKTGKRAASQAPTASKSQAARAHAAAKGQSVSAAKRAAAAARKQAAARKAAAARARAQAKKANANANAKAGTTGTAKTSPARPTQAGGAKAEPKQSSPTPTTTTPQGNGKKASSTAPSSSTTPSTDKGGGPKKP